MACAMVESRRQFANGGSRYWAFISYSQEDSVWAKKLHHRLETYRIPRPLIGRNVDERTIPARLMPVFRDRDELTGDPNLRAKLHEALAASDSLIVICSPHAAKSTWVNEEVRTYKAMGRANRVFSLLVDDKLGAAVQKTDWIGCFPAALRFDVTPEGVITDHCSEPLAADARADKDGWTDASLKLIAGILGIGFDDLRRRERLRQRRRRLAQVAMGIAAALVLCLAYIGLADDDVAIPAGDALRNRLDHYGFTPMRPVMSRDAMERSTSAIRTALRGRVLDGVAAQEIEHEQTLSAWLIGQVVGAAFRDRDTKRDDLQKLTRYYDLLYRPQDGDDVDSRRLAMSVDDVGNPGRAEPVFWAIMGLSAALRRHDALESEQIKRFQEYLGIAQVLAEEHYPLGDGGWNTAVRQLKPEGHFVYTTALALHMLLEVRAANAGWRGSREQLDHMIADTANWLVAAFDVGAIVPGWRRSLDDDKEPDSGITLLAYSALGRACAAAAFDVPTELSQAAILSQSALRLRSYESADPDIRFDVRVNSEKGPSTHVTITRMIWYPWAAEGLVNWRRCAEKRNLPPESMRALDRSLGHLLGDMSPQMLRDVTRAQKPLFVTAETYYGLGDAP
jgi:hypothetical protein